MTHGLLGIARGSVRFDQKTRLLVACLCGDIAGTVDGQLWDAHDNGDGTIALAPSLDWPGHFHEIFSRAPLIDDIFDAALARIPPRATLTNVNDERDLPEHEAEGDETTEPAPAATGIADAPHDADVVRLYVRDAEATAISCAAGAALVVNGAIEVAAHEVERWLATGAVARER